MTPPYHDDPYRDDAAAASHPSRDSQHRTSRSANARPASPARPARESAPRDRRPAGERAQQPSARKAAALVKPMPKPAAKPHVKPVAKPAQRAASGPSRAGRPAARAAAPVASAPAPARRRRSRRGGGSYAPEPQLTSMPITRNAYQDTREWLLKQHGPVCAYCGVRFTAGVMTLDHVAPRRGQTAYDRRDNLVLACKGCNSLKRDLAPAAFLLGARSRAANLLRYGAHLSPMLVDLARSLAPAELIAAAIEAPSRKKTTWGDEDDGADPYAD